MTLDMEQVKAVEAATGHSLFGGSSLPRIVDCPASVSMQLKAGLKPASIYAERGTLLHKKSEIAARQLDPREYIHSQVLTVEDTVYVLDALDYVQSVVEKHSGKGISIPVPDANGEYDMAAIMLMVESGYIVMLLEFTGSLESYGIPESYGSADVVIISLSRTDVIDYKFGHGVAVYAKDNHQLVAYLAMVVPYTEHPDKDHKLYVHINQPTLGIYDEWRVEWDTMYKMILGDVADAVALAKGENPPFGPTVKACRFCDAKMICKERHNSLMAQARMIREMAKNPARIPNEKWADFLSAAESLKVAISDVEKHAVTEIMKGNDFPGFKLVAGRANRVFLDEEEAHRIMEKRLGKRAKGPAPYISLAQAEKLDPGLTKDPNWIKLVHKPTGKPKLVRKEDPGKALVYGVKGVMDQMAKGEI